MFKSYFFVFQWVLWLLRMAKEKHHDTLMLEMGQGLAKFLFHFIIKTSNYSAYSWASWFKTSQIFNIYHLKPLILVYVSVKTTTTKRKEKIEKQKYVFTTGLFLLWVSTAHRKCTNIIAQLKGETMTTMSQSSNLKWGCNRVHRLLTTIFLTKKSTFPKKYNLNPSLPGKDLSHSTTPVHNAGFVLKISNWHEVIRVHFRPIDPNTRSLSQASKLKWKKKIVTQPNYYELLAH